MLNRASCNPAMSGVSGYWKVPASDVPSACRLARQLSGLFSVGQLQAESRVEVIWLEPGQTLESVASSPSARVERWSGAGLWLDRDAESDFYRVYLLPNFDPRAPLLAEGKFELKRAWLEPTWVGVFPQAPSCFVGGLISLSAEPPEGFFAASSAAELELAGYSLRPAQQAHIWLYRVPDARQRSYFDFYHPNPGRETDSCRKGKFLIASGVGPASEPDSPGGVEADLIWVGDEQHGPLLEYLTLLQADQLRWSDFWNHQGLAQKLPDGQVLLCRVDRSWSLTKEGFQKLPSQPEYYRAVYSPSYDEYLRTLFLPEERAADASYLLATSRGCTQGCAICCSGGLKPFQSFPAERMLHELDKIAQHAQTRELIDIFFLDSNFNNAPDRLIEFARLYRESEHFGRFRFFVRHNTVNGFLLPGPVKRPNLKLIEAFHSLGIREIFMGVDTFDDHSTLTLKSNRLQMVVKGADTRPTYRVDELYQLVGALDQSGAFIKAFYLRNNPWVSDLDRIDSYYNLALLWLDWPRFSIDARYSDVNRLKPFDGSPIERVSRGQSSWVQDGRYVATGALGELDELMDVGIFGQPQLQSSREFVVAAFLSQLSRLRARAEERWLRRRCPESRRILAKLLTRDRDLISRFTEQPHFCSPLLAFAQEWAHLPGVSSCEQNLLFQKAAASLFRGLRQELPGARKLPEPLPAAPRQGLVVHSQGYRVRSHWMAPGPCLVA
jgi:hypothetical protein